MISEICPVKYPQSLPYSVWPTKLFDRTPDSGTAGSGISSVPRTLPLIRSSLVPTGR